MFHSIISFHCWRQLKLLWHFTIQNFSFSSGSYIDMIQFIQFFTLPTINFPCQIMCHAAVILSCYHKQWVYICQAMIFNTTHMPPLHVQGSIHTLHNIASDYPYLKMRASYDWFAIEIITSCSSLITSATWHVVLWLLYRINAKNLHYI